MYCTRCEEFLKFVKGNSNILRRHIQNAHVEYLKESKKKVHEEMERKRKSGIESFFSNNSCHAAKK